MSSSMDSLTISLVFGGLSSIFFALANVIDKFGTKKIKSPFSYGLVKSVFNVLILFFLSIFFLNISSIIEAVKISINEWAYSLFGLIVFSLAYVSFLILLVKKKTGNIIALVSVLVLVVQVLIGLFFFKDNVNYFILLVSLSFIIFGILAIHDFDLKLNLNLKEWILLLINVAGFSFFSFYTTLISKKLNEVLNSKLVTILATFIGESVNLLSFLLLLFIAFVLNKAKIKFFLTKFLLENLNIKEINRNLKNLFYPFLGSAFIVLSIVLITVATTFGIFSVSSLVSYLSILWTALISVYLFKEKLKRFHYLGFLLIIIGIVLLKFV